MRRKIIQAAIPYTNASPHIGHALDGIYADFFGRYYAINQQSFVTFGSDDHGIKIQLAAEANKQELSSYISKFSGIFEQLYADLSTKFDVFTSTSNNEPHLKTVQKVWELCKGDIYFKEYEGLYCVGCERYLTKRDLTDDGLCIDHKKKPEPYKQENYFFALSKYTDQIKELYSSKTIEIFPSSRVKEIEVMLEEGLEDVSISRPIETLSNGICVPGDDSQVIYVWFDALINYLSATGYCEDGYDISESWPTSINILGKDIFKFHGTLWLGMLLSAGLEVPKSMLVHGFITKNEDKLSKSTGNIIDPYEMLESYGIDRLRLYICHEVVSSKDHNWDNTKLIDLANSLLADNYGNLINRINTLLLKVEFNSVDCSEFKSNLESKLKESIDVLDYSQYTKTLFRELTILNKEVEDTKPWELIKSNPSKASELLSTINIKLGIITMYLEPVIPDLAIKALKLIDKRETGVLIEKI